MTTMIAEPRIVTIKELAGILKVSESKIYHEWPSWRDKGVRVLKVKENNHPRFHLADVLKMMERAK